MQDLLRWMTTESKEVLPGLTVLQHDNIHGVQNTNSYVSTEWGVLIPPPPPPGETVAHTGRMARPIFMRSAQKSIQDWIYAKPKFRLLLPFKMAAKTWIGVFFHHHTKLVCTCDSLWKAAQVTSMKPHDNRLTLKTKCVNNGTQNGRR